MAKLIQHNNHDPYHVHALVGLLTLLHFFWRFCWAVVWRGDRANAGFGSNPTLDTIALVLLPLPNLTSFLFKGGLNASCCTPRPRTTPSPAEGCEPATSGASRRQWVTSSEKRNIHTRGKVWRFTVS